jgi:hypothetical protein
MEIIRHRKTKSYPVSHSLAAIYRTIQRQYIQFKPNTFSFSKETLLTTVVEFLPRKIQTPTTIGDFY